MKHVLSLFFSLLIFQYAFSQNLDHSFFPKDATNFNTLLQKSFKKKADLLLAKDSLCIESCIFFKITIAAKKVAKLEYSSSHPEIIPKIVREFMETTNGYWNDVDTTIYLLPIVYQFANSECKEIKNSSSQALYALFAGIDSNSGPAFPAWNNAKPLKCTVLKPLYISNLFL